MLGQRHDLSRQPCTTDINQYGHFLVTKVRLTSVLVLLVLLGILTHRSAAYAQQQIFVKDNPDAERWALETYFFVTTRSDYATAEFLSALARGDAEAIVSTEAALRGASTPKEEIAKLRTDFLERFLDKFSGGIGGALATQIEKHLSSDYPDLKVGRTPQLGAGPLDAVNLGSNIKVVAEGMAASPALRDFVDGALKRRYGVRFEASYMQPAARLFYANEKRAADTSTLNRRTAKDIQTLMTGSAKLLGYVADQKDLAKLQEDRIKFDALMQETRAGLSLASFLLSRSDPTAARNVSVIGESAIRIGETAHALSDPKKPIGVLTASNSILLAISAVTALSDSGPSSSKMQFDALMAGLQQISRQLAAIQDSIERLHASVADNFVAVRSDLDSLQLISRKELIKIRELQEQTRWSDRQGTLQNQAADLAQLSIKREHCVGSSRLPANLTSKEKAQCFDDLRNAVLNWPSNARWQATDIPDPATLRAILFERSSIDKMDLAYFQGSFAKLLVAKSSSGIVIRTPNPALWSLFAEDFLRLAKAHGLGFPKRDPHVQEAGKAVLAVGASLEAFTNTVLSNRALRASVVSGYSQQAAEFQEHYKSWRQQFRQIVHNDRSDPKRFDLDILEWGVSKNSKDWQALMLPIGRVLDAIPIEFFEAQELGMGHIEVRHSYFEINPRPDPGTALSRNDGVRFSIRISFVSNRTANRWVLPELDYYLKVNPGSPPIITCARHDKPCTFRHFYREGNGYWNIDRNAQLATVAEFGGAGYKYDPNGIPLEYCSIIDGARFIASGNFEPKRDYSGESQDRGIARARYSQTAPGKTISCAGGDGLPHENWERFLLLLKTEFDAQVYRAGADLPDQTLLQARIAQLPEKFRQDFRDLLLEYSALSDAYAPLRAYALLRSFYDPRDSDCQLAMGSITPQALFSQFIHPDIFATVDISKRLPFLITRGSNINPCDRNVQLQPEVRYLMDLTKAVLSDY